MNAVNPFDLSNTTTLIIGGRGAMGSAIARCAAACGSRIIIGEREPEPNNGDGGSVLFDATSEDSVRAALTKLESLDHVVVAISARASGGSIAETSPAEASQAFKRFWANYNVFALASRTPEAKRFGDADLWQQRAVSRSRIWALDDHAWCYRIPRARGEH